MAKATVKKPFFHSAIGRDLAVGETLTMSADQAARYQAAGYVDVEKAPAPKPAAAKPTAAKPKPEAPQPEAEADSNPPQGEE